MAPTLSSSYSQWPSFTSNLCAVGGPNKTNLSCIYNAKLPAFIS